VVRFAVVLLVAAVGEQLLLGVGERGRGRGRGGWRRAGVAVSAQVVTHLQGCAMPFK